MADHPGHLELGHSTGASEIAHLVWCSVTFRPAARFTGLTSPAELQTVGYRNSSAQRRYGIQSSDSLSGSGKSHPRAVAWLILHAVRASIAAQVSRLLALCAPAVRRLRFYDKVLRTALAMVVGARPFTSQDTAKAISASDSSQKIGLSFHPATPAHVILIRITIPHTR